jgi:exopolysaccharide production protein ExoY
MKQWTRNEDMTFAIKHRPFKRLFDIIFSAFVLIFGAPLFLIIAVGIKLQSKGQVFYTHERIGRGGKPFRCYKFRTMYMDSEARHHALLEKDPLLKDEWERTRKLRNDPRVTPWGLFLRKSSLDELPQFWNVLKGDLSVVGPRPVVYEEIVKYFGSKASKILSFRPGITCIWQVSGRSDIDYSKRIELDEKYVDNYSIFLDLLLIVKTVPSMIFSRGAY